MVRANNDWIKIEGASADSLSSSNDFIGFWKE
jgi:hypothetical protein